MWGWGGVAFSRVFSTVFFLIISAFFGVGGGMLRLRDFCTVLLSNLTKKGGCWALL